MMCGHRWHVVIEGIRYGVVPIGTADERYSAARLIWCPTATAGAA